MIRCTVHFVWMALALSSFGSASVAASSPAVVWLQTECLSQMGLPVEPDVSDLVRLADKEAAMLGRSISDNGWWESLRFFQIADGEYVAIHPGPADISGFSCIALVLKPDLQDLISDLDTIAEITDFRGDPWRLFEDDGTTLSLMRGMIRLEPRERYGLVLANRVAADDHTAFKTVQISLLFRSDLVCEFFPEDCD